MGMEILVPGAPPPLAEIVARVAPAGAVLVMIDGRLRNPRAPLPEAWADLRFKTPAGTLAVARREDGLAVVAWGNADDALRAAQRQLADLLTIDRS